MHPEFLIAGLGIVGICVRSIVKLVMDADVRKIEARRAMQQTSDSVSTSEMEKLRGEIAQLRETSTQHALSLQHSVERLDHRVEFIERNTLQTKNGVDPAVQQQTIGRS